MQWAPMLCWPPEQQDALGQHPCFFTQHSGVSDALLPVAEDIPMGATIMVASRVISASFFMMSLPLDLLITPGSESYNGKNEN
jgi:hypothetical protein